MKNLYKLAFFLALILQVSCKKNNVKNEISEIVFIVNNPDKISTNIGTGVNIKTLNKFNYNTARVFDTFNIKVNKYQKVYLKNDSTFKYNIFKSGDTVFLNIGKKGIGVKIKDRVFKKYDTISLAFLYENYLKKEIAKIKLFQKKIYIKDDWTQKKKINKTFIDSNKNIFLDYHVSLNHLAYKSNEILNKILEQDSISLPYYHYFKSQNNYKAYSDILEAYIHSNDNYLKNQIIKYFDSDEVVNDDFIAYGYMNGFISKKLINTNGYNFQESYDTLPLFMSGNVLKFSQLICLKKIASNYDFSIFQTYKNKYLSSYGKDDVYGIVENLTPVFIEEKDLSELQLQDLNGKTMTLKELINSNTEKVMYIDYWASWCVPCRQMMSESEKLRDEYTKEDISFVYISIDTDLKKWNNSSRDEGLNTLSYNLLATNYPEASFYKKIELKYIPRYLLIKNGKLENRNAPRPDTKEIRILLDKYLKE